MQCSVFTLSASHFSVLCTCKELVCFVAVSIMFIQDKLFLALFMFYSIVSLSGLGINKCPLLETCIVWSDTLDSTLHA